MRCGLDTLVPGIHPLPLSRRIPPPSGSFLSSLRCHPLTPALPQFGPAGELLRPPHTHTHPQLGFVVSLLLARPALQLVSCSEPLSESAIFPISGALRLNGDVAVGDDETLTDQVDDSEFMLFRCEQGGGAG